MELDRTISHDDLRRLAVVMRGRGMAWLDGDGSAELGARSFLAFDPLETRAARFGALDPLGALGHALEAAPAGERGGAGDDLPRWIGAFAYDLAWSDPARFGLRVAPRLSRPMDSLVAWLRRYRVMLGVEHATGRARLAVDRAHAADERAVLAEIEHVLDAPAVPPRASASRVIAEPRAVHRRAIEDALAAIARGDLYQVNLARRWTASLEGEPLALYLAMRTASAVPLGACLEAPDGSTLLSRSMERFVSFDARTRAIETRPIKGTVRRTPAGEDASDLRADDKERAEHAMIVDLMRNDLGRIAETGSVRPRELFRVEPYARLSHLVSIVEARARRGVGAREILVATFPPGSVTGAPKLAAIEHVERLERFARGFYTGAIGTISADGSLALSVAIRTAHVRGGALEYFAGGGIVEASDPEREVDETELKARVLEDALATLRG